MSWGRQEKLNQKEALKISMIENDSKRSTIEQVQAAPEHKPAPVWESNIDKLE